MKKFDDLTPEEQEEAIEAHLVEILVQITAGALSVRDRGVQSAITDAIGKAYMDGIPWLAHKYILKAEAVNDSGEEIDVKDYLYSAADDLAKDDDTYYMEPHETACRLGSTIP